MKIIIVLLLPLSFFLSGHSQPPVKRIDSIVNIIESKKNLTLHTVSDTFPTVNPDVSTIESVKFHFVKTKLNKVSFTCYYYSKDPAKGNTVIQFDIFYFYNDSLIKVSSRDFDETPPKNIPFYIGEKEHKRYLAVRSRNFGKHDGANYYIDLGYALLEEFKLLIKNKKLAP